MDRKVIVRDAEGQCMPGTVYDIDGEWMYQGIPIRPNGRATTLRGWGECDGPADEWIGDHTSWTVLLPSS